MKRLFNFKKIGHNYTTHWQWYKDFFSITILKYFVTWFALVPLVANFRNKIPNEINIFDFIIIDLSFLRALPFSWEILWWASFFYVVALSVYYLRCPRFIKDYSSYGDYIKHGHSPRWIIWLVKYLFKEKNIIKRFYERVLIKEYIKKEDSNENIPNEKLVFVDVNKQKTICYFKMETDTFSISMPLNDKDAQENVYEYEKDLFWEVFGAYSSSRTTARLLILLMLSISGIMFLIVLLQHILSIILYFIY